jgi:uncharacterized protein (TIGR03546 family)
MAADCLTRYSTGMITRKLGKLLRGNATPFQLMAASILGTLIGFAPSVGQAPALYVILIAVLLIANANLGLALLCAGLGHILALVSAPLSYSLGTFLLDGPTSGIAHGVVNAPILAWCGLEYYVVAGGQLLGLAIGMLIGLFLCFTVRGIRKRMVAAKDNPSRMQDLAAKPWARFLMWLFVGGKSKQSWEEKLAVRVGNPIRTWGAVLMLVMLAGVYFGQEALAEPLASQALKSELETSNGATVDLGLLELNIDEGRVALFDLALADAGDLNTDVFRAGHLEADIGQADLLRKRLHITRLVIKGASSGLQRATPGKLTMDGAASSTDSATEEAEGSPLEEFIEDYETLKQRLAEAREWMEKLGGSTEDDDASSDALAKSQAKQNGWLLLQADHLIDEAPTFRLSELIIEDLETSFLTGSKLNIRATELSTHPHLLEESPRFEMHSQDGLFDFLVDLAPASKSGGDGALKFSWKELQVDEVMSQLKLPGGTPFHGGTLELNIDGTWDEGRIGWVDLPLKVVLRNTSFQMEGMAATPLVELTLSIGLKGRIDSPSISFDSSDLSDALVAAGKKELAGRLQAELGGKLDGLGEELGLDVPALEAAIEDTGLKEAAGLLKGVFGGK